MRLKQLSVFLENRIGRLAEAARVLAESGVNLRALSLAETLDFGILRLLVDNNETAIRALSDRGFTVRATEVIAVEVPDRPGGLVEVLELLQSSTVNIEYMYAFLEPHEDKAVIVFRFEDTEKAIHILEQAKIKVFSAEEISQL